ncbi:MAG: hypothetical protein KDH96_13025, partial [Candidatus Riesia sp.]|nr:hypothetical protein [Candidatus Riesia sp.]
MILDLYIGEVVRQKTSDVEWNFFDFDMYISLCGYNFWSSYHLSYRREIREILYARPQPINTHTTKGEILRITGILIVVLSLITLISS